MTRDIHSPANVVPEHYEYVETVYLGPEKVDKFGFSVTPEGATYHDVEGLLKSSKYFGNFHAKGTCDHCGARFVYGAVYDHIPSGDTIVVGNVCADTVFGSSSRRELDLKRAKDHVALARQKTRLGMAVASFLALHEGLESALSVNHAIARDLRGSLTCYGNLSPKQVELAFNVAKQVAEREAEVPVVYADVVEGTRVLTGRVLSTKFVENAYGGAIKMLLLTEQNEKVWGTAPTALLEQRVVRGDLVRFTASVERSKDDAKFGFFSRPRKAEMVETAEAGTVARLADEADYADLREALLPLCVSRDGREALREALQKREKAFADYATEKLFWTLAGY